MPGARNIEWKNTGQVETKKICKFRAVMLGGAAKQGLDQEERGHDKKEPGAGSLRRRQRDRIWRAKRKTQVFPTVPTQEVPSSECRQQKPRAPKKRNQGK